MAGSNGTPFSSMSRNCFTVRTALVSSGGAATQPIFQPVTLNDLPALPTMISAFPHAGQGGDRDVPAAVKNKVIVHLVCDDDKVVPLGDIGRSPSLQSDVKHFAGGVMQRVSRIALILVVTAAPRSSGSKRRDPPSPLSFAAKRDRTGDPRRRGLSRRRTNRSKARGRPLRHPPGECQNGCRDPLGSAGGDQHLAIGVVVELITTSMVVAYRLTQLGDARPGGYWLCPSRIAAIASART